MAVPQQRNPEATRDALERWLTITSGAAASVSNVRGPAATGYSHETVIFDTANETLVARVEPTTHNVFLDPVFMHEYRVMDALSRHTSVRVPRIRAFEEDRSWLGAPFFVMEHVEGVIPPDNPPYTFGGWMAEAPPEDQARAWWSGIEAMAEVHATDWHALGLEYLARGVSGELAYAERMFEWASRDGDIPVARAALEWLQRHLPEEPAQPALCWGDSRLGNQIFRSFECVALLDWEMATVADPELDLGWWLYFDRVFAEGLGVTRPAGFPSHAETIARYESLTGRTVRHVEWHEVFAGFRFAYIMLRIGAMMKLYGELPPDSDFGTNNFATDMLVRVLDEVAPVPAGE